ncbi:MAG: putative colanic acid biosynthesis acetyltransferase [Bacteroidetes bacterium]|uniref:Colanic acid biosynthesis acetyltransferase n=1 Tax=Candidatus Cryptobacteroides intestinigallinarum TaxID=2840767 RepID=A0A9D9HK24_9BACT|nr:putative colanic acid biosynthesis acetyltransferase [Candidatus Cryptobacteroides intestinigallinarum]
MTDPIIDLSKYHNSLSRKNQLIRLIWSIIWTISARWLPRSTGSHWKILLLKIFGAQIDKTAVIYSSAKIYYPANLIMGKYSCLASDVNCYNVDKIVVMDNSTVSQGAFLCTASHDITDPLNHLITAPIVIQDQAWVAADAFIGMGVTIGQGAVVGARAAVFKNVEPWTVVGGNPAKFIKKRIIKE